jgi:hypothetical protein
MNKEKLSKLRRKLKKKLCRERNWRNEEGKLSKED